MTADYYYLDDNNTEKQADRQMEGRDTYRDISEQPVPPPLSRWSHTTWCIWVDHQQNVFLILTKVKNTLYLQNVTLNIAPREFLATQLVDPQTSVNSVNCNLETEIAQ